MVHDLQNILRAHDMFVHIMSSPDAANKAIA